MNVCRRCIWSLLGAAGLPLGRLVRAPLWLLVLYLAVACSSTVAPIITGPNFVGGSGYPIAGTGGAPTLLMAPRVAIRAGVMSLPAFAPLFIAYHRGYFDQMGIDVDFTAG